MSCCTSQHGGRDGPCPRKNQAGRGLHGVFFVRLLGVCTGLPRAVRTVGARATDVVLVVVQSFVLPHLA